VSGTASVPFADLATASATLAGTRSRLQKKRILVDLLAAVPREEVSAAVGWLVAEPLSGRIGVGPAQLWAMSSRSAPEHSTLGLREVEDSLAAAKGSGREATASTVAWLFERMTEPERALLAGALTGSLRQGSLGGVMMLALAELSGQPEAAVRRAVLLAGSITQAADALLGTAAHEQALPPSVTLFRPLAPMLAAPAESLDVALSGIAAPLLEWKIDGVRAQVHKQGSRVAAYSRQGNDITAGCKPVADALALLDASEAIVDGEVVLVGPEGAPRAFQDSFSVIASKSTPRAGDRLAVYLFDCLHRDGTDLLDEPLSRRREALASVAPPDLLTPSLAAKDLAEAKRFYADALSHGHEGVVVKDLGAPYTLGARGRAWQKVKEFATVDLVVLAAEWGSGRRKGFLSNLHLGARRGDGTFCMVGKTFKGLTDELLRWQTARLEQLASSREGHVVRVRPELVVEIRYNDVQRSSRYAGGIALRFARVVRYREDKAAAEAEPLEALVARLPALAQERQLTLFT
jgi:DNA ligase-1